MNNFYNDLAQKIMLPCGLTVYVASMPDFAGVHAIYGTDFGSVDRTFCDDKGEVTLPAGIAHFLEHKMFENEDGDAFTLYAKTGASANAYTSFDKTCYLFTATENIRESLDILLSFVSKPYFTDATVEKEQGIIGQEIRMYDDNPDWRLFFGVLSSLYVNHDIKEDIAGTVESISEITPELLYRCTDAFYASSNMVLAVAGNITKQEVLDACERAGLNSGSVAEPVKRITREEPETVAVKNSELRLAVGLPMIGIGYKEKPLPEENSARGELICAILSELISGSMTPLYRKLYDEGLISNELSCEFLSGRGYLNFIFSAETRSPEQVENLLKSEIARLKSQGLPEDIFNAAKNSIYGDYVTEFDSPEDVATMMSGAFFKHREPFCELSLINEITFEEVVKAFGDMFDEQRSSTLVIKPLED